MTAHTCHWPGCKRAVPPAMWGCQAHWFALPQDIRRAIWRAYVPGQEIAKNPTRAYIDAAKRAQEWIANRERNLPTLQHTDGKMR